MPLYEYRCKKCQHTFEKIQKFSDSPVRKCPQCGGPVERLVSPPTVQFKGTGWYVTDYAHKSGSGKSSASDSDSAKSDSKPAEKSESKTAEKKKGSS